MNPTEAAWYFIILVMMELGNNIGDDRAWTVLCSYEHLNMLLPQTVVNKINTESIHQLKLYFMAIVIPATCTKIVDIYAGNYQLAKTFVSKKCDQWGLWWRCSSRMNYLYMLNLSRWCYRCVKDVCSLVMHVVTILCLPQTWDGNWLLQKLTTLFQSHLIDQYILLNWDE